MPESDNTTRAEAERQMVVVASLFRDAVQVTPAADEVDALPAVSMDALPNELLQHIFKRVTRLSRTSPCT